MYTLCIAHFHPSHYLQSFSFLTALPATPTLTNSIKHRPTTRTHEFEVVDEAGAGAELELGHEHGLGVGLEVDVKLLVEDGLHVVERHVLDRLRARARLGAGLKTAGEVRGSTVSTERTAALPVDTSKSPTVFLRKCSILANDSELYQAKIELTKQLKMN